MLNFIWNVLSMFMVFKFNNKYVLSKVIEAGPQLLSGIASGLNNTKDAIIPDIIYVQELKVTQM